MTNKTAATVCSEISGIIGGYETEEQADAVYKLLSGALCGSVAGWKPIETPPRDQQTVIAWCAENSVSPSGIVIAEWLFPMSKWVRWPDLVVITERITHWMPLPAPPGERK